MRAKIKSSRRASHAATICIVNDPSSLEPVFENAALGLDGF